nr:MAG TPA: hypothetical protein [Caudoviricetes sp.]
MNSRMKTVETLIDIQKQKGKRNIDFMEEVV